MDGSILPCLPLVERAQYAATPTIATSATAPTTMPTIMPTLVGSPSSSEDEGLGDTCDAEPEGTTGDAEPEGWADDAEPEGTTDDADDC